MDTNSPEFRELLEAAAEAGARKALCDVGLSDDEAVHDMHELRTLLDSWRSVKRNVGETTTRFLTLAILTAIAMWAGLKVWSD